jgi:hypothetical protein
MKIKVEYDEPFDPYRWLTDYAAHLDGIRRRGLFASPFYDVMSGALVWTDEKNRRTPVEVVWALRCLWAYRTSLMLNKPRVDCEEFWSFGLERFPHWVGFRPRRRVPTPRLLRLYRRGDVGTRRCLRQLEREAADA